MITNMANIGLVDKAATPVTHQFTPTPIPGTPARWSDKEHNNGIAIGFAVVSLKVTEPVNGNGLYRVSINASFPKVNMSVPTNPVLLGTTRYKGEFTFPVELTLQERKDVVNMIYSMIAQGSASTLGDNIAELTLPY